MAKMKKKSIQEKKPEENTNSEMVDRHVDNTYSNKLGDLLDSRNDETLSELVELRDRLTKDK